MSNGRLWDYEEGAEYLIYGSWHTGKPCGSPRATVLRAKCVHVSKVSGRGVLCDPDTSHRRWSFRPTGYALLSTDVFKQPLAVVLCRVKPATRSITIDGKTIEISEESFQSLKKELCQ